MTGPSPTIASFRRGSPLRPTSSRPVSIAILVGFEARCLHCNNKVSDFFCLSLCSRLQPGVGWTVLASSSSLSLDFCQHKAWLPRGTGGTEVFVRLVHLAKRHHIVLHIIRYYFSSPSPPFPLSIFTSNFCPICLYFRASTFCVWVSQIKGRGRHGRAARLGYLGNGNFLPGKEFGFVSEHMETGVSYDRPAEREQSKKKKSKLT